MPYFIHRDMDGFEYNASPARVIFGSDTISRLSDELARLQLTTPLLLLTARQGRLESQLKEILSGKLAGVFREARMHTPISVTESALAYAKSVNADSIISIGGGTTIGLGKAISIRTGLPHIAIPTTYAGSEMTPILGETQDGKKTTRNDPKILPGLVIYDVDLTMSLPASMSATSGVKCDGRQPTCIPCSNYEIPCTYLEKPKHKSKIFKSRCINRATATEIVLLSV